MDLHQNARLTFRSRETLANQIMIEKVTLKAAAAAFNVSRKTAAKWVHRYRILGLPGLRDRSSRPALSSPGTPPIFLAADRATTAVPLGSTACACAAFPCSEKGVAVRFSPGQSSLCP